MPRFPAKTKSRLYADMAKYARSGIGIQKACESMLEQSRLPLPIRGFCEGLITGLDDKQSIASSLDHIRVPIGPLEKAVIDAAERGGSIEQGFEYLSDHFKSAHETRRRILRGLIYPIIMLHFALLVSILGTTVFTSFGPKSSGIDWSASLDSLKWIGLIYIVLVALIYLLIKLWKSVPSSLVIDRLFSKLPIWGTAFRTLAWERFCSAFAIFIRSGLRISDAFRGAGRASQSAAINRVARKCATKVEDGSDATLAELFQSHRLFPEDLVRGISAADETGGLDKEFQWWADHYRDEGREKIDIVAKWTPKLFYFIVLLLVAWLVIRVALSYYGMIGEWIDQI